MFSKGPHLNHARVIDEHVDAAIAPQHPLQRLLHLRPVAHVAGEGLKPPRRAL